MEHFRMEMESLSENEEFARVVMAVFMSRMNPTLEQVDDVKTAVSEAVTNAVIHGYRNREGIIVLAGEIQGTWLTVTVEDQGTGIRDVKRAMEPMYTTDRTGERSGMGFSFMEAFMDQVQVESEPGKGTVVRMRKEIRQGSGRGEEEETGEAEKIHGAGKAGGPEHGCGAAEAGMPEKIHGAGKAGGPEHGCSAAEAGIRETACAAEVPWVSEAEGGQESGDIREPSGSGAAGTGAVRTRSSKTARVIRALLSLLP